MKSKEEKEKWVGGLRKAVGEMERREGKGGGGEEESWECVKSKGWLKKRGDFLKVFFFFFFLDLFVVMFYY